MCFETCLTQRYRNYMPEEASQTLATRGIYVYTQRASIKSQTQLQDICSQTLNHNTRLSVIRVNFP